MGDHESDGQEYQDDEEEDDEDDEPVHDLTGGGALSSVQPPAATAAPRLHNAPRECVIRMPTGKAANPQARGPITPATGPGQASTRFCNLAEALLATSSASATKLQSQSVRSVSCSCTVTRAPRTADRATGANKLVMNALAPKGWKLMKLSSIPTKQFTKVFSY